MKYLLVLIVAGLAVPAGAAPLCRDAKGLFTPCPPAVTRAYRARRAAKAQPETAEASSEPETAAAPGTVPVARQAHPGRSAKPALVARTRLCHDAKGLFTPCPR